MPFYDYECGDCGEQTRMFSTITNKAKTCPKCKQETLERVWQPAHKIQVEQKPGDIAKETIRENRELLKEFGRK